MKTQIIGWTRSKPTLTEKRFSKIEGAGKAFISDKSKHKPDHICYKIYPSSHMTQEEIIIEAAKFGCDIFYKTSTYYGASEVYISKEYVIHALYKPALGIKEIATCFK